MSRSSVPWIGSRGDMVAPAFSIPAVLAVSSQFADDGGKGDPATRHVGGQKPLAFRFAFFDIRCKEAAADEARLFGLAARQRGGEFSAQSLRRLIEQMEGESGSDEIGRKQDAEDHAHGELRVSYEPQPGSATLKFLGIVHREAVVIIRIILSRRRNRAGLNRPKTSEPSSS